MKIVLASASPRRFELLKKIVPSFTVEVAPSEAPLVGIPSRAVMKTAESKGIAVFRSMIEGGRDTNDTVIISADTTVVCKRKFLGKPKDCDEAFEMLKTLNNTPNFVYTGVCLLVCKGKTYEKICFYDKSKVVLHFDDEKQISDYVATRSPLDKAGAYGIQDGMRYEYVGSMDNIIGLPTEKLSFELEKIFRNAEKE